MAPSVRFIMPVLLPLGILMPSDSKTAEWEPVYQTDFSSDPDWTTNVPDQMYWDSATGRYHLELRPGGAQYAAVAVPDLSGRSFKIEFELTLAQVDYSSAVSFGLGTTETDPGSYSIWVNYGNGDGGNGALAGFRGASQSVSFPSPYEFLYALDTPYHNTIAYDFWSQSIRWEVTSGGLPVASYVQDGVLILTGIERIFCSNEVQGTAVAYLDNLVVSEDAESLRQCDDFEDGTIDGSLWVVGGGARGTWTSDPIGTGLWSHSGEEILDTDGYLRMRVWGPESGNTFGGEAWVRSDHDFNDGLSHVLDFTWDLELPEFHYNLFYIQITDGFIPAQGDLHWPIRWPPLPPITEADLSGTKDLLWQGDSPDSLHRGWNFEYTPSFGKVSWSITIDRSGIARLYDGAAAGGSLLKEAFLDPQKAWYVRFLVSDGTSGGFPAGDMSFRLYSFCARTTGPAPGCDAMLLLEEVETSTCGRAQVRAFLTNSCPVEGFSFGVRHDPLVLQPIACRPSGAAASLNGGAGPEFWHASLAALGDACGDGSAGITVGMIGSLGFPAGSSIPAGANQEIATITYAAVPGTDDGAESSLDFVNCLRPGLDTEITRCVVTSRSTSLLPRNVSGKVRIAGVCFRRGDCNCDAAFDISDPITILNFLFDAGSLVTLPCCQDACDADGGGSLDVSDGIRMLARLFLGSQELPEPFVDCGLDPGDDPLSCPSFRPCS